MKAIMITIKPEHLVNILKGKKTLELRTWIPKDYKGWVYVACSKSKPYLTKTIMEDKYFCSNARFADLLNGKVVCRFWFDEWEEILNEPINKIVDEDGCYYFTNDIDSDLLLDESCLSYEELDNYLYGEKGYAWHIKNLEVFDEPKELGEYLKKPIKDEIHRGLREYLLRTGKEENDKEKITMGLSFGLKKAPQKMTYIWVKEEE